MDEQERGAYARRWADHLDIKNQYDISREALDDLRVRRRSGEPVPLQRDVEEGLGAPSVLYALSRMPAGMPRPTLVISPVLHEAKDRVVPGKRRIRRGPVPNTTPQRLAAAFNDPSQDLWEPSVFADDRLWNQYKPHEHNTDTLDTAVGGKPKRRDHTVGAGWTVRLVLRDQYEPTSPHALLNVPGLVHRGESRTQQRHAFVGEQGRYGDALSLATVADGIVLHAIDRVLASHKPRPAPARDEHFAEPSDPRRRNIPPRSKGHATSAPPEALLADSATVFIQHKAHQGNVGRLSVPAVLVEDDQIRLSSVPLNGGANAGFLRGIRVLPWT
jgi:hypothetical protein